MILFRCPKHCLLGQRNGLLKIVKSIPICRIVKQIRIYRISVEIFKKVLTLTLRHSIYSVLRGDKIENAD